MEETTATPPLFTVQVPPIVAVNRIFAPIYMFAILALFYRHTQILLNSPNFITFFLTLILFIADLVLTFMWCTAQAFRLFQIRRQEFPENLEKVLKRSDFPAMDVFICTADPTKEPPIGVVNTALSVMAYDYPPEKLSVYVSDDGGSAVTLFAFMEAAKFASQWLPFCRENNIVERSPEAYFESNSSAISDEIKLEGL
ncbi:cellulose synthase-like protein G2 [Euphorbia lathyris]|uniref:cellulose synthase-like protein G2 n=1 Tax=Euphorbia lathyris TaxID=212925 RepID=UPI0033131F4C